MAQPAQHMNERITNGQMHRAAASSAIITGIPELTRCLPGDHLAPAVVAGADRNRQRPHRAEPPGPRPEPRRPDGPDPSADRRRAADRCAHWPALRQGPGTWRAPPDYGSAGRGVCGWRAARSSRCALRARDGLLDDVVTLKRYSPSSRRRRRPRLRDHVGARSPTPCPTRPGRRWPAVAVLVAVHHSPGDARQVRAPGHGFSRTRPDRKAADS